MTDSPAFLIVIRCCILNKDNRALVIKRAKENSYASGKWELPGGKVEEDVISAAKREVAEEVDIDVGLFGTIISPESYFIEAGEYAGSIYIGHCAVAEKMSHYQRVTLSDEHDKAYWLTPRNMLAYERVTDFTLTSETRVAVRHLITANLV